MRGENMKKIKTAILGYGRSGSSLHANPIDDLERFQMQAVCDIDPAALENAKTRFGCATYTDYRKMIADEDLDLVVVVTRSDQHKEMVIDCLRAGHNVLITKPWCRNEAEATEMIECAKESKGQLLPWLPARWGADFLKLKTLVESGIIGNVFQIRRREYGFGIRYDWQTKKEFGGGMVQNWGPHLIEPPMLLAGGKAISVYGNVKQVINPGDTEDNFMSILTMDNGVTVISEMGTLSAPGYENWIVQGDKGSILVRETEVEIRKATLVDSLDEAAYSNKFKLEIVRDNADGPHRITHGNRYGDAKVIYPQIAQAVLNEVDYPVTLESALTLTKIMDAVKKSSESRQCIQIS
jgi:scyllo-inositol 2-dehydrogenase (NADP+)